MKLKIQAPTVTAQPQAQLPPVSPSYAQTPSPTIPKIEEQKVGIDTELTTQHKLKLLEERLLRGEIDQELFESPKAKFELEAKPYETAKKLPPPTGAPTIVTQPQ